MAKQAVVLNALGLITAPARSKSPEGGMAQATNAVIDADGLLSRRRGFELLTQNMPADPDMTIVDSFASYAGHLLVHYAPAYGTSDPAPLYSYNPDTNVWTVLGSFAPADTDGRLRFSRASGSLFFTTSQGIMKMDGPTSTPQSAGQLKALNMLLLSLNDVAAENWLSANAQVAYRYTLYSEDAQGRALEGPPSGRLVVANNTAGSRTVTIQLLLPERITTNHRVRLYRSSASTDLNTEPLDSMGLVYERHVTEMEAAQGFLNITDDTPDSMRSTSLYTGTNQNLIADQNDPPDFRARDITTWKGFHWAADITEKHRLFTNLISTTADKLPDGTYLTVGGYRFRAFTGGSTSSEFHVVNTVDSSSAGQNIRTTAESIVSVINRGNGDHYAYYMSSDTDMPGKLLIEARDPSDGAFYLGTDGDGAAWSPNIADDMRYAPGGYSSRLGGIVTVNTRTRNGTSPVEHGFTVGQQIQVSCWNPDEEYFPVGTFAVASVPSATSFTLVVSDTGPSSSYSIPSPYEFTTPQGGSTATRKPNALRFSKHNMFEAWPMANEILVGEAEFPILRIIPLKDALIVLKADGAFMVTGSGPENFSVQPIDQTVQFIAPNCAVALAGCVFALTTQGVAKVTEGGVSILSLPFENELLPLLSEESTRDRIERNGFAIGHDTERKFHLFVGYEISTDNVYSRPLSAYTYNLATGTWTHQERRCTAGFCNPADDYVYLGDPNSPSILKEKRRWNRYDYADESKGTVVVESIETVNGRCVVTLSLPAPWIEVGDLLDIDNGNAGLAPGVVIETGPTSELHSRQYVVRAPLDWTTPTNPINVRPPIPVTVEYLPVVPNPGTTSRFFEVTLVWKEAGWTTLDVSFATDVSTDWETVTVTNGPGILGDGRKTTRVTVPRSKSRGTQLRVKIENNDPQAEFKLEGMTVVINGSSKKAGETMKIGVTPKLSLEDLQELSPAEQLEKLVTGLNQLNQNLTQALEAVPSHEILNIRVRIPTSTWTDPGDGTPPPEMTGDGWPLLITTSVRSPQAVEVIKVQDVSKDQNPRTTILGAPFLDWEFSSTGQIRVKSVTGLVPTRTYALTIRISG